MIDSARTALKQIAFPTALAVVFTSVAYAASGANLGLLLCGLFGAGFTLALCDQPKLPVVIRTLQCATIIHAVAVVFLIAVFASRVSFLQWLQSYAVLVAVSSTFFALLLAGSNSKLIALLWIIWFASPVLMAHAMLAQHGQNVADFITRYHPLFAFNRVLLDQGLWTGGDIAYRFLTPLGQDVPYALPETIWPCVIGHLLITGVCLLVWRARRRRRRIATAPC